MSINKFLDIYIYIYTHINIYIYIYNTVKPPRGSRNQKYFRVQRCLYTGLVAFLAWLLACVFYFVCLFACLLALVVCLFA